MVGFIRVAKGAAGTVGIYRVELLSCLQDEQEAVHLMQKLLRTRTYHRREISESLFGAAKQKYGSA